MDLIESKIFAIVTLGLASIIVGILPACFTGQGRRQWPLLLSTLLCFGGGVLLSTSMVHILPELREAFPQQYREYAELVYCLGFFLLYMLDEIVHFFYGDAHELSFLHDHQARSHDHHRSYAVRRHSTSSKYTYGAIETDPLCPENLQLPYNPSFFRAHSDSVLCQDDTPSQLCHVGHQEPCRAAPTGNLGLLVALSVHALLEGLVVGLEESSAKVLLLLGAIASHKLVVGFCLGVEIAANPAQTFCRHFVYILIFSLGSSGGILIGMFISNIPGQIQSIAIPVLQGLAGGTLLYVTVSEVLPRERARWHQQTVKRGAGVLQFIAVIVGFILMTAFSKYLDYDA